MALLTHNIRITSLEYDDREKDAYGARRVLVSTFSSDDKSVTGRVAACSQHCSYRGAGKMGWKGVGDDEGSEES